MKVLFLDNDGVICLSNNWGGRTKKWAKYRSKNPSSPESKSEAPVDVRFDNFDEKSVRILNEILKKTGSEIVVSSDWRFHATLNELGEYYLSQGVCKKPIATTDMFKDIFPSEWAKLRFRADLELERSMEIQHWLDNHSEVTHWVAVDDLNMSDGLTNFVHTKRQNEGIKQMGIKQKIMSYLQ